MVLLAPVPAGYLMRGNIVPKIPEGLVPVAGQIAAIRTTRKSDAAGNMTDEPKDVRALVLTGDGGHEVTFSLADAAIVRPTPTHSYAGMVRYSNGEMNGNPWLSCKHERDILPGDLDFLHSLTKNATKAAA